VREAVAVFMVMTRPPTCEVTHTCSTMSPNHWTPASCHWDMMSESLAGSGCIGEVDVEAEAKIGECGRCTAEREGDRAVRASRWCCLLRSPLATHTHTHTLSTHTKHTHNMDDTDGIVCSQSAGVVELITLDEFCVRFQLMGHNEHQVFSMVDAHLRNTMRDVCRANHVYISDVPEYVWPSVYRHRLFGIIKMCLAQALETIRSLQAELDERR